MNFSNKKVAILGWGIDTEDVVPWLISQDAEITVYDRKERTDCRYENKLKWMVGSDDFGDLSKFEVIVRNPAVYRYRREIVAAEKNGTEITSKIKLFFDLCPAKIIGVTGTKGKGTTSTLIYEIMKKAGKDVFIGGNMGEKVFGFLPKLTNDSWVVLELSSFQLIDLHKSPHIAVVLMTTVDHQDWHVGVDEYVNAKASITKYQDTNDFAVVNKDYENSRKIGDVGRGRKVWVSKTDLTMRVEDIRLRGEHNRENVIAALAVGRIMKVDDQVVKQVVSEFKGLEHRLEEVAKVKGVTYYDDSISTVPETAIAAIKAFTEPMILILGGSDKGSDFSQLGREIAKKGSIKAVILIGLMAEKIEEALRKSKCKGKILIGGNSMKEVVIRAKKEAKPGDVVVLSPACASFDMFKNYKDRGDQFKSAVKAL